MSVLRNVSTTSPNQRVYRIGVICSSPSAQMSAQYDALADLEDFEFHLLFRHRSQGNPAWAPVCPTKVKHDFLPPYKGSLTPSKLKRCLNGNVTGLLESYDFDAMILHGIYDSSAVWQAIAWCNAHKRPYFLRGDANIAREKSLFRRFSRRLLIGKRIRSAAGLLYIGTQNQKYYELFGARQEQFFLAPWEIDYENLELTNKKFSKMRGEIRRELGFSNEVVFLFLGRILELKGLDTVIPVIKRLRGEGLPIRFLIGGDGPYLPVLKSKHKLADCEYIKCLGSVAREEVCKWYNCADVFVLSSYQEAWGLVVNEAVLCGLPLVVSDQVGAGADLVVQWKNGFIYPARDKDMLHDYLKRLTVDSKLREEMGKASGQILRSWRENASAIKGYKKALDHVTQLYNTHKNQDQFIDE